MHYEMKAETLKFFMPTTATRLADCAKDIKEALARHRCMLVAVNGEIQIVTKNDDAGLTLKRGEG